MQTKYYFTNEFEKFFDIIKQSNSTEFFFRKGQIIKHASQQFDFNYYIVDGICKLSIFHDSGNEKIIGFWGAGSIYPIICDKQNFFLEYSIIVTAITDVRTLRFSCDQTQKMIAENSLFSKEIINHYGKFTNLLLFYLTVQSYENIKSRICSILFIFYDNSKIYDFPLTQSELASIIGAKRESVVKIIKELKKREIITTDKRKIKILSIDKLIKESSLLIQ